MLKILFVPIKSNNIICNMIVVMQFALYLILRFLINDLQFKLLRVDIIYY